MDGKLKSIDMTAFRFARNTIFNIPHHNQHSIYNDSKTVLYKWVRFSKELKIDKKRSKSCPRTTGLWIIFWRSSPFFCLSFCGVVKGNRLRIKNSRLPLLWGAPAEWNKHQKINEPKCHKPHYARVTRYK